MAKRVPRHNNRGENKKFIGKTVEINVNAITAKLCLDVFDNVEASHMELVKVLMFIS